MHKKKTVAYLVHQVIDHSLWALTLTYGIKLPFVQQNRELTHIMVELLWCMLQHWATPSISLIRLLATCFPFRVSLTYGIDARGAELGVGKVCRPREVGMGSKMFNDSGLNTSLYIENFIFLFGGCREALIAFFPLRGFLYFRRVCMALWELAP